MLPIVYCPMFCKAGKIVFKDIPDHFASVHSSHLARSTASDDICLFCLFYKQTITLPKVQDEELEKHVWCKTIEMKSWERQDASGVDPTVGDLPAKNLRLQPRLVRFYFVSRIDNGAFISWVYVHGSPLDAKQFAFTVSMTGSSTNKFTYNDFVKPLDTNAIEITSEGRVFFVQKNAFDDCRRIEVEEKGKMAWEVEVTIHDLYEADWNEETEQENDSVDDGALKVEDAPKQQPFFKKVLSSVKRKMSSSSASNRNLLDMTANCELKKDVKPDVEG